MLGSRPAVSQAAWTRSNCSWVSLTGTKARLNSSAYSAASRGVRRGPPRPYLNNTIRGLASLPLRALPA